MVRTTKPMHFSQLRTPGGYLCGEVTSAMQKSIRRCKVEEALFWASELEIAGYSNYVWKRLRLICSEDIGLANDLIVLQVKALEENYRTAKQLKTDYRLYLAHAVVLMARSPKSRMIDSMVAYMWEADRAAMGYKIPDHALDKHTSAGRRMGRDTDHFYNEGGGSMVENEPFPDEYREKARAAFKRMKTQGFGLPWAPELGGPSGDLTEGAEPYGELMNEEAQLDLQAKLDE